MSKQKQPMGLTGAQLCAIARARHGCKLQWSPSDSFEPGSLAQVFTQEHEKLVAEVKQLREKLAEASTEIDFARSGIVGLEEDVAKLQRALVDATTVLSGFGIDRYTCSNCKRMTATKEYVCWRCGYDDSEDDDAG